MTVPTLSPRNPGRGARLRTAFSSEGRTWVESVDLLQTLASALGDRGHASNLNGSWLELPSGLTLLPQVAEIKPKNPSGAQTTSTIQVGHTSFPSPGFFEYQHSAGDSLEDSFSKGFNAWVEFDLPAITDALRGDPEICMAINTTIEGVARRIVLGPPIHVAADSSPDLDSEHPFCPCCLVTQSFDAFEPLLESSAFCAVRLYAMRGADGGISADCRVNGEDFEAGRQALLRYVERWPERGFEYRKQLAIIQSTP